jgi:hypothetical protein
VKRNKIRELVRDQKVDFLAIQESKLEVVTKGLCFNLWGSGDCDWAALPSQGNSGGIISMWNKEKFNIIFFFYWRWFCGCLFEYCRGSEGVFCGECLCKL